MLVGTRSPWRPTERSPHRFPCAPGGGAGGSLSPEKARGKRIPFTSVAAQYLFRKPLLLSAQDAKRREVTEPATGSAEGSSLENGNAKEKAVSGRRS